MENDELNTVASQAASTGQTMPVEADEELLRNVAALMDRGDRGMVMNILTDLYPPDLAELISHLSPDRQQLVLTWLSAEQAGKVLAELDSGIRSEILEDLPADAIAELLNELDSDDAADVIADLPAHVASDVLPRLADSEDIGGLLAYPAETAGGIMSAELVAIRDDSSVAEATDEVRRQAAIVEPVFVVYVVDARRHLKGQVPLKQLLLSPSETRINEIMEDVISVQPAMDQEEVARIMQRYDLVSLPVVDDKGRLLGRITIDDVIDVIREEAEEDIQRISGIAQGDEGLTDSIPTVVRGRLPWLVIGLAGTIMAAFVVRTFEASLEAVAVLAAFIPVMTAMAGNAAIQSAAITVQGMASGKLWGKDMIKRVGREFLVALMNGVALAFILGAVVVSFQFGGEESMRLSLVAGLSLFVVVVLATTNGALFPVLLDRLGIDPALSMGPFVTTSNDIVGLTVYFLIATSLYF